MVLVKFEKKRGSLESLARQMQESFNLRGIEENNGGSEKADLLYFRKRK
jgi:hypothetical protein